LPLYEYDHLVDWATAHRHIADEITLLCDQHHREKTSRLLTSGDVADANRTPHNRKQGVSKPYDLHYSGDYCEIIIGGNTFAMSDRGYGTPLIPVSIDGMPLLAFLLGDGHLLLNLNLFDEFNRLIVQISDNELVQSVEPWDIQFVGRNLVIREARRHILVDITFDVPNRIVVNRGRFLLNGVEILVRPEGVFVVNNRASYSGVSASNCWRGVTIGPHDPPGALLAFDEVSRYPSERTAEVQRWISEAFGR
jgi:trigger factor